MAGAPVEAYVLVPTPEKIDDGLCRHPIGSLAFNQKPATSDDCRLGIFEECVSEIVVHRDDPARLPFACRVLQTDGMPDLTSCIRNHPPGQAGYFFGP